MVDISAQRPTVSQRDAHRLQTRLPINLYDFLFHQVNIAWAIALPLKAQRLCFTVEEQLVFEALRQLPPHCRETILSHANTLLSTDPPSLKMQEQLSRSSSVYSDRRGSRIDLKEALKELDLYYWKTHQDFLHEFNKRHSPKSSVEEAVIDPSPHERGRSQRPSFKRAISAGLGSASPPVPPTPGDIISVPPTPPPKSAARSKSWAPPRRSASKHHRAASPNPSIIGPSEYLNDADTRARLRMYFSDPDKFDEMLEHGFPSVVASPALNESPIIPPPKTPTRGRNPGLDVQRFLRNDVISWMGSESHVSAEEIPESNSEREIEDFTRELVVQNAVPVAAEEHYDRDFDISDYEHAIDDSQDDRRTPSPISPITPCTPDEIPLPLAHRSAPIAEPFPGHTGKSIQRSKSTSQKSGHHAQLSKSKSEVDLRASVHAMIRTAPPLPARPEILPIKTNIDLSPVSPLSHASKISDGSISVTDLPSPTFSPRSLEQTGQRRPHSAHRRSRHAPKLSDSEPTPALPPSQRPTFTSAESASQPAEAKPTRKHKSHHNLRASMSKDLPPTPAERPSTAKKMPPKYAYDSPSAYIAPCSPPPTPAPPVDIPRQMTLRMTLTRPELRATDEDIYGRRRSKTDAPLQYYQQKQQAKLQSELARHSDETDHVPTLKKRRSIKRPQRKDSLSNASFPPLPTPAPTQIQDLEKREPKKLRKTKTEPLYDHTSSDPKSAPALFQPSTDGEWQSTAYSLRGPNPLLNHPVQTHVQSAPADQIEFRVAQAEVAPKENRRSLWKKMSFVGLKRSSGPAVVLP